MIGFGVDSSAIRVTDLILGQQLRQYQKNIKGDLRVAGRLVRKRQRKLLRGGAFGPKARKVERVTKRNIGRTTRRSQLVAEHKVIVRKSKRHFGEFEVFIGPTPGGPAFYGKFQELGVQQIRRTQSGASRGTLPKRPWMQPAYEQVAEGVEGIMGSSFRAFKPNSL